MKIMTDTSAMITLEEAHEFNIEILPLNIVINNKVYREYYEINQEELLKYIDDGELPTTSQLNLGELVEILESNKDEDIMIFTMSEGLSGTYQTALMAKDMVDSENKIEVINTKTLAGPNNYIVKKAAALRNAGSSFDDIVEKTRNNLEDNKSFLIVRDFEFLKRGGRLSAVSCKLGGLLNVIPVLTLSEDSKSLENYKIKKTLKGVLKLVKKEFEALNYEDYVIYIAYVGEKEKVNDCVNYLEKELKMPIIKEELSPAFITHVGKGGIAFQIIKTF